MIFHKNDFPSPLPSEQSYIWILDEISYSFTYSNEVRTENFKFIHVRLHYI